MARLTDYTSYADAQRALLVRGAVGALRRRSRVGSTSRHECIDRHAADAARRRPHRPCRRARRGDHLSRASPTWSSRFAHWLAERGIAPGRSRGDHAGAVAAFYVGAVRRDEARRHRGAAVHPLRPGRACGCASTTARRASCWSRRREGRRSRAAFPASSVVVADDALPGRARARTRPLRRRQTARRRSGGLPVHLRHHARAARGGAPHPSRHRDADGRRALRHRHPARRPLLLPVVAGLGPRALARHAGAAGARRHDRHLRRASSTPVRLLRALAGLRDHQPVGGGHALPDDEELGRARRDYRYAIRKLSFTGEPIDSATLALRRARPSTPRRAACTAPPRSA